MPAPFFQRFRWSDPDALTRELEAAATAHRAAQAAGDATNELEYACRLGVALTAADREAEAAALLEAALPKARALAEPALVAWVLLYLATARQYLGNREQAHTLFSESLEIVEAHALRDIEHYVWHHRGRCFAEDRNIASARLCFERALSIRLQLGEPRAARTRQALAALDTL